MNKDLQQIAQHFSRAASSYDAQADLQRRILRAGTALIIPHLTPTAHLLDAGCGTGAFARALESKTKTMRLIGMDLAAGMCAASTPCYRAVAQADLAQMPFANASFDGVICNLAMQWVHEMPRAMSQLYAVLRPGGVMMLSAFVTGTLAELDAAARAEGVSSVITMRSAEEYAEACRQAGFHMLGSETVRETHYFERALDVAKHLRALGASKPSSSSGMMGKDRFTRMLSRYDAMHRPDCGIPASWHAVIFMLQKPL